jgi:hypothetical protein
MRPSGTEYILRAEALIKLRTMQPSCPFGPQEPLSTPITSNQTGKSSEILTSVSRFLFSQSGAKTGIPAKIPHFPALPHFLRFAASAIARSIKRVAKC